MLTINNAAMRKMDSVKKELKQWCRLCAKVDRDNAVAIVLDSQVRSSDEVNIICAIKKYFEIVIMQENDLPQVVCTECLSILKQFIKYAAHVTKVQEMYKDVQNLTKITVYNLRTLREKYELPNEDQLANDDDTCLTVATTAADMQSKPKTKIRRVDILPSVLVTASKSLADGDEQSNKTHQAYDENDPLDQDSDLEFLDAAPNSISLSDDDPVNAYIEREKVIALIEEEKTGEEDDKSTLDKELFKTIETAIEIKGEQEEQYTTDARTKRSYKRAAIKKVATLAEKHIYTCTTCNKTFQRKGELSKHNKSVHETKSSAVCEECGKVLSSKSALIDHMYTHSKDAPFKCKDCGKGFKHKGFLNKHKSIHGDKHICAECGLQLNSRATLYNHLLVHSDVKRHKCDYCGRAYKRSKTLKNHLIVHSGLRPYACDFCDKTFTHPTTCRQHKKNIHPKEFAAQEASGEKPQRAGNVPKLATLKEVTRTAKNLAPALHKPNSGNYSIGAKRPKIVEEEANRTQMRKRTAVNYSTISKSTDENLSKSLESVSLPQQQEEQQIQQ